MNNKLIFIGGGNMAQAMLSKLVNSNSEIIVIQKNIEKLNKLKQEYPSIHFAPTLDFSTTADTLIILAVKPQDAQNACLDIAHLITNSTVISVMTGISTSTLNTWLNNNKIARVMPNTPASIGLGVSGIYFTPNINNSQKEVIKNIFNYIGKTYIFTEEDSINKITATAGSAPAYLFYFIESMIESTINIGFSKDEAIEMVLQVLKGSLGLIENNPQLSLQQLRSNITSKKGTTEQAINIFEKYNLKKIVDEAENAAYHRAQEISKLYQ
ncbi:MAG TPA: pyrroline-5-carboxylate reductase [Burkholderiales bacterium]|nr:pyrroline-5-carboxylate reductase [Burkholderiales bacterium]